MEVAAPDLIGRAAARRKLPEYIDALDLEREPEQEHDWLIDGFLERQGRVLLAGAEGTGKSLLALTMAVQAAAGHRVGQLFNMAYPHRVLYMDLEMSRASVRRRVRQLRISCKGDLERGALYLLMRPDGIDLSVPAEREMLAQIVADEVDIVVVDPLYKATLTDSVYERDIKPTLQFFDRLRLEHNIGLVLIHHLRKRPQGEADRGRDSSDIFGSSVLLRWPETALILNETTLRVVKDRDDIFTAARTFRVHRGGRWPMSLEPGAQGPGEELVERLTAEGPMSAYALRRAVKKRNEDVLSALRGLQAENRVIEMENGKWAVL